METGKNFNDSKRTQDRFVESHENEGSRFPCSLMWVECKPLYCATVVLSAVVWPLLTSSPKIGRVRTAPSFSRLLKLWNPWNNYCKAWKPATKNSTYSLEAVNTLWIYMEGTSPDLAEIVQLNRVAPINSEGRFFSILPAMDNIRKTMTGELTFMSTAFINGNKDTTLTLQQIYPLSPAYGAWGYGCRWGKCKLKNLYLVKNELLNRWSMSLNRTEWALKYSPVTNDAV